ncbi:MAG: hypothetical protein R3D67_22455 [Hyphomicrobiaceae bacterium]
MLSKACGNHSFFTDVVKKFHRQSTRLHPKLPLIPFFKYGVATNRLPATYDAYFMAIEGSARRNIKKAMRNGYQFQRIDFNRHLADAGEIHRSTPVRQGPMGAEYLTKDPDPVTDPPSSRSIHDYVYYGVLKDGKLVAYGATLVAGEALFITTIFGHDGYKSDAVVPLLIAGIAKEAYETYPNVKYYIYDKFFGASPTLRRFKKKFGFEPCTVTLTL